MERQQHSKKNGPKVPFAPREKLSPTNLFSQSSQKSYERSREFLFKPKVPKKINHFASLVDSFVLFLLLKPNNIAR